MNNEELVNKAIKPLIEMYAKIESDLLSMIAEHFQMNAEFLNSDYWRIQKLEEMGLFNDEVIEYLAQYTNSTKEDILKSLEEVGYDTFNINKLESAFENGKIKINPNILIENNTIQNIINSAYNELANHFIELSNKILNSTREAYLNVVEEGYLKTSMGTHSYQEAIRESLNNLGNKGITTLTYTTTDDEGNVTGIRNYDVEGTVRRDILTGVRSLSNSINKTVVEELECEWVYLSEHLRCRPTHFDWQGTIIKYQDLIDVTHYGEVDGLAGINCAHYFEPYFGNARGDDLKTISKEEATKQYNLSQQQRYLERGIRKWKRKVEMFKINGDNEAFLKSKDKVKEWQNRLSNFTKENSLRRKHDREYVYQRYPDWYVKLSQEEKIALNQYISSDSYKINEKLYNNIDLVRDDKSMVEKIDNALDKIPMYKGYVNRSVFIKNQQHLNKILSVFDNEDLVGKWNSYVSSSKIVYDDSAELQFKILSKTGRNITSLNKKEQEILFKRNTKFKIIDYHQKNGKINISLEEIE